MGGNWVRRLSWDRRRTGIVLAAVLVVLLVLLLIIRPWPLTRAPSPLQGRVDATVSSLADYRDRIEASLRLQFLEAALVDGRRSAELSTDYRLIEEQLEPIIARMDDDSGPALEAQLDDLLPDLTRDRSAAAERLEEMQALLLPPMGLERQGDLP